MIIVNVKRTALLPTGEEKKVRETYLSNKETCSEATLHVLEAVGDVEVLSTKKAKYMDVLGDENFYSAKVDILMLDGDKEKHKKVTILVAGDSFLDAFNTLENYLKPCDARVISLSETKILEYIK